MLNAVFPCSPFNPCSFLVGQKLTSYNSEIKRLEAMDLESDYYPSDISHSTLILQDIRLAIKEDYLRSLRKGKGLFLSGISSALWTDCVISRDEILFLHVCCSLSFTNTFLSHGVVVRHPAIQRTSDLFQSYDHPRSGMSIRRDHRGLLHGQCLSDRLNQTGLDRCEKTFSSSLPGNHDETSDYRTWSFPDGLFTSPCLIIEQHGSMYAMR